nr:SpoIIE family protein phosphatase [Angustibacter aerolatus]
MLAPVTERGEALGLLELVVPAEPSPDTVAEIARTAHLLGFVVVASRRHTDLFEWAQRSTPYSLSAEIQRRLLPAGYTCETGQFTLSAWLEPSASVGGDTYDYSLARDVLHLSMTDAMGHGVDNSLLATLCVGSLRYARRHGLSLPEQAAVANEALCAQRTSVPGDGFCTGLLGRLDLTDGVLEPGERRPRRAVPAARRGSRHRRPGAGRAVRPLRRDPLPGAAPAAAAG